MIKAVVQTALGEKLLVLGLTRENIDRMLTNQPILFDARALGLPPQKICIIAGETEGEIVEDLRSIGWRNPGGL